MKYLVTGAAGFIGFHVAQRLCRDGHQVVGLDNLNDYYEVSLKEARLALLLPLPGFRFERMDLADRATMAALFARERFDRVIHLGAQAGVRYSLDNPFAYADSNLNGTLTVLGQESNAMIAGIAGLGHIAITAGMIVFFVALRRAVTGRTPVPAEAAAA